MTLRYLVLVDENYEDFDDEENDVLTQMTTTI